MHHILNSKSSISGVRNRVLKTSKTERNKLLKTNGRYNRAVFNAGDALQVGMFYNKISGCQVKRRLSARRTQQPKPWLATTAQPLAQPTVITTIGRLRRLILEDIEFPTCLLIPLMTMKIIWTWLYRSIANFKVSGEVLELVGSRAAMPQSSRAPPLQSCSGGARGRDDGSQNGRRVDGNGRGRDDGSQNGRRVDGNGGGR